MKNLIYTSVVITTLLGIVSCSDASKDSTTETVDRINVQVTQVSDDGSDAYLSVSGSLAAKNSAALSTRVMGHVEKVNVSIGDKVVKGQLLVQLNSADLKAKKAQVNAGIAEAQAAFNIAEKDYYRFQKLFEQNSASQKELDDVTAHYTMAKARLDAAQEMRNEIDAQFAYTNVLAPFNGVITSRFVEIGDLASPGMPLLAIEGPNQFEVEARIPESSIAKITKGLNTTVQIPSINTLVEGTVTEVSSSSSYTGGQYLVNMELSSSNEKMRSGMFVTVNFPSVKSTSSNEGTKVLIPQSIVITRGGLTGIYDE
jgi:RND family efflux transporter MFP subunit